MNRAKFGREEQVPVEVKEGGGRSGVGVQNEGVRKGVNNQSLIREGTSFVNVVQGGGVLEVRSWVCDRHW